MVFLEFEVGDTAWFYHGDHKGKLSSGKVVHKMMIPDYAGNTWYYIIAIPTGVDDLLIVREGWTLSDHEHEPIGIYRGLRTK